MIDIGRVKCVVPVSTGQFSFAETGCVYTNAKGKTFILTYKFLNDLISRNNYGTTIEQPKIGE